MNFPMVFNGSLLDQLILTSSQPGTIQLVATSTVELTEQVLASGNFYGYPTV